jgi:hypothetical protein
MDMPQISQKHSNNQMTTQDIDDFRTKPDELKKRVKQLQDEILNCDHECKCPHCTKSDNGISYNTNHTFDDKK